MTEASFPNRRICDLSPRQPPRLCTSATLAWALAFGKGPVGDPPYAHTHVNPLLPRPHSSQQLTSLFTVRNALCERLGIPSFQSAHERRVASLEQYCSAGTAG
ncbi:hypothetical protein BV22DRAFT_1036004 [Leucogyrophana mollusca]|uniref:Uncharacterized protein n=1 Tax=Leucogyrophana mollusca TaxID=85980 RepID=A0ACB8BEP9_9AGAM|nr:hypothetical protein BV22DRAFT_1036004 [Leucogyrophana mollusca]